MKDNSMHPLSKKDSIAAVEEKLYVELDKVLKLFIDTLSGGCESCSLKDLGAIRKNQCKTCGENKQNWVYCIFKLYK